MESMEVQKKTQKKGTQIIVGPRVVSCVPCLAFLFADVTVNGIGVQALDVNGHYFMPVTIQPGSHLILVEVKDSAGRLLTFTPRSVISGSSCTTHLSRQSWANLDAIACIESRPSLYCNVPT